MVLTSTSGFKVKDVIELMNTWYPPELAAAWDNVGLQVGDENQKVQRILVALDPSEAVVDEAIEGGVDLLVTHHPLVMQGINSFTTESLIGRVLFKLNKHDISLFAAHTNADVANDGVNDVLARLLGLNEIEPLLPLAALGGSSSSTDSGQSNGSLRKIVVFVPESHLEQVIDAMAKAGAGQIGNYDRCAYHSQGHGTFRPLPGANPHTGKLGEVEVTSEMRVEMVMNANSTSEVVTALRQAHPYEEPAFDVVNLVETSSSGLGRQGSLPKPISLKDFAKHVASVVPKTHHGVRVAGDLSASISKVGLVTGAGANLVTNLHSSRIDAYVTADAKHHVTLDNLMNQGPNLVDLSHWASESPWCAYLTQRLTERFVSVGSPVTVTHSKIMGDPWSLRLE